MAPELESEIRHKVRPDSIGQLIYLLGVDRDRLNSYRLSFYLCGGAGVGSYGRDGGLLRRALSPSSSASHAGEFSAVSLTSYLIQRGAAPSSYWRHHVASSGTVRNKRWCSVSYGALLPPWDRGSTPSAGSPPPAPEAHSPGVGSFCWAWPVMHTAV